MQVATILPNKYLHLNEKDAYHMCLAQLVGVDATYTNYYRAIAERKDTFVILDNGAAEGEQPTCEQLIPKIQVIKPSEVVLPDTVYERVETLRKGLEAISTLNKFYPNRNFQLMAVPQGFTTKDWMTCAKDMVQWDSIDTIGISKFLTRACGAEARLRAVEYLIQIMQDMGIKKQIHLLGCENHPLEVHHIFQRVPYARDYIRGTDSAIAYVYTHEGLNLRKEFNRPPFEMHFSNTPKLDDALEKLLIENINTWKEYCHEV